MKKSLKNSDIFENAKIVAEEAKNWSPERIKLAQDNIKAIESTYTDQKYLDKGRVYFKKNK